MIHHNLSVMEDVDIIEIFINGRSFNTNGLINFAEPDRDEPYWLFEYEDGTHLVVSGNVIVQYHVRGQ